MLPCLYRSIIAVVFNRLASGSRAQHAGPAERPLRRNERHVVGEAKRDDPGGRWMASHRERRQRKLINKFLTFRKSAV
jgi:hypothetical protein